MVTEDGTVWNPTSQSDPEVASSMSMSTQVVGSQAPVDSKTPVAGAQSSTPPETGPDPVITSAAVNAAIEAEFASSVQSFSAQSQNDEYEHTEQLRPSFMRKAAVIAGTATIALLVGAVALAKSPKSRALLTFLACTAPTTAMQAGSGPVYKVHSSVYSKSQALISGGASPTRKGL